MEEDAFKGEMVLRRRRPKNSMDKSHRGCRSWRGPVLLMRKCEEKPVSSVSVLFSQCVAVCCSVLQCFVAACRSNFDS